MVITYHRQKAILIFLVQGYLWLSHTTGRKLYWYSSYIACSTAAARKKNTNIQYKKEQTDRQRTNNNNKQKDPTHKVITYHRQRGSQSHTDIPRTSPVRSPAPGRGRRATRGSSTRAGTRTGTRLSGTRTPSGARTAKPNTPPSAQCRQPKALKSTVKWSLDVNRYFTEKNQIYRI